MELNIAFEGEDAVKDAAALKEFIEGKYMPGLNSIELQREPHKPGEQGLGALIGGLLVKLSGGEDVVKEVLVTIQKFADMFDKRVHFGNGVIVPGGKLTGDQIVEIMANRKQ